MSWHTFTMSEFQENKQNNLSPFPNGGYFSRLDSIINMLEPIKRKKEFMSSSDNIEDGQERDPTLNKFKVKLHLQSLIQKSLILKSKKHL